MSYSCSHDSRVNQTEATQKRPDLENNSSRAFCLKKSKKKPPLRRRPPERRNVGEGVERHSAAAHRDLRPHRVVPMAVRDVALQHRVPARNILAPYVGKQSLHGGNPATLDVLEQQGGTHVRVAGPGGCGGEGMGDGERGGSLVGVTGAQRMRVEEALFAAEATADRNDLLPQAPRFIWEWKLDALSLSWRADAECG
jgi:hypothetical protein